MGRCYIFCERKREFNMQMLLWDQENLNFLIYLKVLECIHLLGGFVVFFMLAPNSEQL